MEDKKIMYSDFIELVPHFLSEIIAIVLIGILIIGKKLYKKNFKKPIHFISLLTALTLDIIIVLLHALVVFDIANINPYIVLILGIFLFLAYIFFLIINWKNLNKILFYIFLGFYIFSFVYEILTHIFNKEILICCGHIAETIVQVVSYFLIIDIMIKWRLKK